VKLVGGALGHLGGYLRIASLDPGTNLVVEMAL
jgi:hypothetical protein